MADGICGRASFSTHILGTEPFAQIGPPRTPLDIELELVWRPKGPAALYISAHDQSGHGVEDFQNALQAKETLRASQTKCATSPVTAAIRGRPLMVVVVVVVCAFVCVCVCVGVIVGGVGISLLFF